MNEQVIDWSKQRQLISNQQLVDVIAKMFVDQLKIDQESDLVSDCVLYAPRFRTALNKKTRAADRAAYILMPYETEKERIASFKYYKDLIKSLVIRRKLQDSKKRARSEAQRKREILYKKGFTDEDIDNIQGPICSMVRNPKAMPIEISDEKDMVPFYDFLKETLPSRNELKDEIFLEFPRGAYFIHDNRMDLCKQGVGEKNILRLISSLKENRSIEHFLFGNNIVGEPGAKAIRDFLETETDISIKTWYLAGNNFATDSIKHLCEGLKLHKECRQLWLKRNPIKEEGIPFISDLIIHSYIEVLDVSYCGLLDSGAIKLFEALNQSQIKHLYVDGNGLTAACMPSLKTQLSHNSCKLETLYISVNHLEDEGIEILAEALATNTSLKRLDVGSNCISDRGLNTLFPKSYNLTFLNVGSWKSEYDLRSKPNKLQTHDTLLDLIEKGSLKCLSMKKLDIPPDILWKIAARLQYNRDMVVFEYNKNGVLKELNLEIQRILDRNNVNSSRRLKHGDYVFDIDSIYRNRNM